MLIPMAAALLACGLVMRSDDPVSGVGEGSAAPIEEIPVQLDEPSPQAVGGIPRSITGESFISPYAGDSSLEEKIIRNQVIVRATMTSFSSEVVVDTEGKYRTVLKFNLSVNEYLKGTGPSSIVAVWVDGWPQDTQEDADNWKATILAERDSQWDDREAVIFLFSVTGSFGTLIDTQLQLADHFLLSLGDEDVFDDRYSLHSKSDREWLPAATSTSSMGVSQEFLLDVPPPTETITLGDLKTRITEVTAELNRGDGSEEYKDCVLNKYRYLRNQRNWPEERGHPYGVWDLVHSLVSGQPAGTVLDWRQLHGDDPITNYESPIRFEGRDADLFDTAVTESTILEMAGEYVETKYVEIVRLARPLPAGEYRFDLKEPRRRYASCNFVISNEWTVTAVAPEGVLHEAFFRPGDGRQRSCRGRHQRRAQAHGVHRRQRRVRDHPTHRVGSRNGKDRSQFPHRACGSVRGLHRAGRRGIAVAGRCGRGGGCRQQLAELERVVPAVGGRRQADGTHPQGGAARSGSNPHAYATIPDSVMNYEANDSPHTAGLYASGLLPLHTKRRTDRARSRQHGEHISARSRRYWQHIGATPLFWRHLNRRTYLDFSRCRQSPFGANDD